MKRMPRILLGFLAALLCLALAPALSAQDEGGPVVAQVHKVDATGPEVEASILSNNYGVAADQVSVSEGGSGIAVSSVRRASQTGENFEIIYVVDTSQRNAQGEVFDRVLAALAEDIRSHKPGTRVAVISAGDSAIVRIEPTTDLLAASSAVRDLKMSRNSVLFNALDRAGSLVTTDPGWTSTVVVFAGGPDVGSVLGTGQARVSLVQKGAQVVAVRYNGGEPGLAEIIDRVGGAVVETTLPNQLQPALIAAGDMAGDRLIVTYPGTVERTSRGDATITIAGYQSEFSYPGGVVTNRLLALEAEEIVEPGGISFFRSSTGLYVAILLAFIGIGLAIFSLGQLFLGGETSLQGLLDRYSGEGDGAQLDEEEQALVQTALVKRAVEFSETFAEDQGFLGRIEELLERAKLPLRPGEAMSFFFAGIVITSVLGFALTRSIIGLIVFGFMAGVIMLMGVQYKARRRMRQFEMQLPDTLGLLAGTLRAGYSLPQGLEAVSNEIADPMGYELRRVMTEARLGREIEDALGSTAERLSSPDFAWAVMAIGIQREVGGNLNELLMTVADTMVARERLKGEIATLTAEGKMSAIILGMLPPGLGLVMWIMNPEYINVLFTETLGNVLLVLGFISAMAGFAWMKKVITIDV